MTTHEIAIFGAGIAGLTAAHELAERGYTVHVYESLDAPGGKARSYDVHRPSREPNDPNPAIFPGEHGFRFLYFPFYCHTFDTLRRIPAGSTSAGTVFDRLREVGEGENPHGIKNWPGLAEGLPSFLLKLLSSSRARAAGELEYETFQSYVERSRFGARGDSARSIRDLSDLATTTLQAIKSSRAATSAIWRLVCSSLNARFVVFDAPTSDAWFSPWLEHLSRLGVEFHWRTGVERIEASEAGVAAVRVRSGRVEWDVRAKHYISALPQNVLKQVLPPEMLAGNLVGNLPLLEDAWMVGFQYYLQERIEGMPDSGHIVVRGSPFMISGIQQTDVWSAEARRRLADRGMGCRAIVSLVVSDFDTPGLLFGKPARLCTEEEIEREIWAQLVAGSSHEPYGSALASASYVAFSIDPALTLTGNGSAANSLPLFVPAVGTFSARPSVVTGIPNLFIAGDFARTTTELVCMEAANEAGRRAANGVLERDGRQPESCRLFSHEEQVPVPDVVLELQRLDEHLFAIGQPHIFDLVEPQFVADFVNRSSELLDSKSTQQALDSASRLFGEGMRALLDTPAFHTRAREVAMRQASAGARSSPPAMETSGGLESASFWSQRILPVTSLPRNPPENLAAYIDTRSPVYEPTIYSAAAQGSSNRVDFVSAATRWFPLQPEQLAHLSELLGAMHLVSLMVDDCLDSTNTRRGREAAHVKFGSSQTIGGAYSTLFRVLVSAGAFLGDHVLAVIIEELSRAHHFNALEVCFRERGFPPGVEEYFSVVDGKTGGFFRGACRAIAALSENPAAPRTLQELVHFSDTVGRFFQVRDDYLDLTSPEYFAKKGSDASDFVEGKFSYPTVEGIARHPELREKFVEALRRGPRLSREEIAGLKHILEERGSFARTVEALHGLYRECLASCARIDLALGTETNYEMLRWLDSLARVLPFENHAEAAMPAAAGTRDGAVRLTRISTSVIKRALRVVLGTRGLFLEQSERGEHTFWRCFPVVMAVETYMIGIDTLNESRESRSPDIEALIQRGFWRPLAERLHWPVSELESLFREAIQYYASEKLWMGAERSEILQQDTISSMARGKIVDWLILRWTFEQLLQTESLRASDVLVPITEGGVPALLHALARVEEREHPDDAKTGRYNVLSHFVATYGEETGRRRFHAYLQDLGSRLAHEDDLKRSAHVYQWMRKDQSMKDDNAEASAPTIDFEPFGFADRAANLARFCEMPILSNAILREGNYTWMADYLAGDGRKSLIDELSAQIISGPRARASL